MINAVFAHGPDGEFGLGDSMPWDPLPEDMRFFFKKTYGTTLLMGYNTWKTLPITPTANRPFIVVTSKNITPETEHVRFITYPQALEFLAATNMNVSVIGGASLLVPEVLDLCDRLYVTVVNKVKKPDVYLLPETLAYLQTCNLDKIYTANTHCRYKA